MRVGERDTLVRFERRSAATDDLGTEIGGWTLIARAWCAIAFGKAWERREAASTGVGASCSITALSGDAAGVIERDRAVFDGQIWDIAGVAREGRGEIEFTAARGAAEQQE